MNATEKQDKNQYLLFDADTISTISTEQFTPQFYQQHSGLQQSTNGRGKVLFIECESIPCILRHYYRGGWMAKFNRDFFLWSGVTGTRAWREWYLLSRIRAFGLPVPKPIAARVIKAGVFYRADIIVERIVDSRTLSDWLQERPLDDALWKAIGVVLRRFHHRGVYHADLNASNILITASNEIFLIDFDKGEFRDSHRSWQQHNLSRLLRSLHKFLRKNAKFNFSDNNWQVLLSGYTQK